MSETSAFSVLDLRERSIGVQGGMLLAHLVPIMGTFTSVELRGNKLGDKGWGAFFAAICGNKDSKIMSMDASCENINPAGIAEALRTSVTGALTVTNLLSNKLDAGPANEELSKEEARI